MEQLKTMKNQLVSLVQGQLSHPDCVNTTELGEAVDMIKDLSEASYYCAITKAMEESEEAKKKQNYPAPAQDYNNRYYSTPNGGNGNNGSNRMYTTPSRRMPMYYTPEYREYPYENEYIMSYDPREGRAKESRRMYMESKEMHKDSNTQMMDLEKYVQDLTHDITEMIADASPTEKQVLQQKINLLADKIM